MSIKSVSIWGITMFIVLLGSINLADFDNSHLQWAQGVSGKLMRGDVLTYNGYSVEAIGFPAPVESAKYAPEPEEPVEAFVALNVSKNGSFIDTVALRLAESYITPDGELKVTASQLPAKNAKEWIFESYAPWAVIELNPRGTPDLSISIQTDKDKYVSSYNTEVVATVTLENTGSADAVNVDMVIDTELPINRGNLKYHYDKIKLGESITESITFASPILTEPKIFSISANASGYDVMNVPYTAMSIQSISMAAELPVVLSVRKSTVDKMYLKDYTIVSLSVKNNGRMDAKNVNITDSLPPGFRLLGNQSLHWVADIPAGAEWEYRYLVRPQEANKEGIVFPAATAEFTVRNEFYSIQSNQPRIVVYGPKIVLTKQADISEFNPGDTVTVSIVAENAGSTPTRVTIMDTLPDKVVLVSGSTSVEGFLEATRTISFSYTLRIDSKDNITLPAANAEYFELGSKGRKISTNSQEVELYLKSANITPVPNVTVPKITPIPAQIATPVPVPNVTVPKITPIPAQIATPAPVSTLTVPPAIDREVNTFFLSTILGCNYTNISGFTRTACDFFMQRSVEPQVNLSIKKSTVGSMLLKDYTSVSLFVINNGTDDLKNMIITDSLPDTFRVLGNQSLQWTVDIPANGMREYYYLIRPEKPSKEGIVFPAATAKFMVKNRVYTIRSNQPVILVYGPKILLRKQTDVSQASPGDNVTVNIVAENAGNAPTSIIISDSLPDGVTLVSGRTTYEGVLEADMKASFNYTIRIDSEKPVKLPPATADYYEYESKGRKLGTKSQELEIQIK